AEMMARLGDVFTDGRLTPSMVEGALAATTTEPVPILDRYIALTSGGSSGQRGVFVMDREALAEFVGTLCRPIVARLRVNGGPPHGGSAGGDGRPAAGGSAHPDDPPPLGGARPRMRTAYAHRGAAAISVHPGARHPAAP